MIKRIKLILIAVVLLAAVAAGLYFYFFHAKEDYRCQRRPCQPD